MTASQESACTFCRIIRGELDAAVVFEDDVSFAFLDVRPLFPGHTLLVPKDHHETLMDLPPELVGPLFKNAQDIARAVEAAMQAEGIFTAINNRVSQSVPHLHVHIVPRRKGDGLRGFFWPRRRYDGDAHIERVRNAIQSALREGEPGR